MESITCRKKASEPFFPVSYSSEEVFLSQIGFVEGAKLNKYIWLGKGHAVCEDREEGEGGEMEKQKRERERWGVGDMYTLWLRWASLMEFFFFLN